MRLRARPRLLAVFAGVLLIAAIGIGREIAVIYNHFAQLGHRVGGQTSSPSVPSAEFPPANMVVEDSRVREIMTNYRVGRKAANYIAQAKIQVLNQTDTSVHFVLTFPDQTTLDETVTIAADPHYTSPPADQQTTMQARSKTHGAKLALKKAGPKTWTYTLQYHVPYDALPNDLRQKIRPASGGGSRAAHFFDLVSPVYADGGEVAGEAVISVIANYFAESYKSWKLIGGEWEEFESAKSLGADVPLAMVDLLEDGLTFKGWMDELGKLENCVKNPTNPLSQKASQDPNYQHEVVDQLNDAVGDVKSTAVPTLASDAAGYLSHFLPFGGGAVTTLVLSTQDEAVSGYAEDRIKEAEKYIVPCEDMPEPPEKSRGDGSITFHTRLDHYLDFDEYDRFVKSDFDLYRGPMGTVELRGTGEFKQRSKSPRFAFTSKCTGTAEIRGNGGYLGGGGTLSVSGNMVAGDCEQNERGKITHPGITGADPGAECRFTNVDLVNGGNYTTHAEGEPFWSKATECTLELRPRPK